MERRAEGLVEEDEEFFEIYGEPVFYDDIRLYWRNKLPRLTEESRDELLIRLDERVRDLKEDDIPEIKQTLERQNGRIRRNSIAIAAIVGSGALGGGVFGLIKLLA